MRTIELAEEEFLLIKKNQLTKLFEENKSISICFNKNVLNLYYDIGTAIGANRTEFIYLAHLKKIPKSYYNPDEEETYSVVLRKALSPLDVDKAISTLIHYYKNIKANKKTIIEDLTQEEINYIVLKLNKPIDC